MRQAYESATDNHGQLKGHMRKHLFFYRAGSAARLRGMGYHTELALDMGCGWGGMDGDEGGMTLLMVWMGNSTLEMNKELSIFKSKCPPVDHSSKRI